MSSTPAPPLTLEPPEPPRPGVTFEQFLAGIDEDTRAEWVDGEIVPMSPASAEHQRLVVFLVRLIGQYVVTHRLGVVFVAPFIMRLATRPSGREPDLLFVAQERVDRIQATHLDGPADLVVEIVSPESDERDRGAKFLEYEAGGVAEYWLLDPTRREAYYYQRGPDERYHLQEVDSAGRYCSAALSGFQLRPARLWEQPLPAVNEVLAEMLP
jgi:Uma2 family endonuclease